MSESDQFQQAALVEIHERGVETAGTVCAASDGVDWIPAFVDYRRADAVRILDFAHAMEYVAEEGAGSSRALALLPRIPGEGPFSDAFQLS